MTIRELLGLINLPIKYYSDFDMLTKLEEETLRYTELLNKYDCDDFQDEQKERLQKKIMALKKDVEKINCMLIETLKNYENANPKGAQEAFDLIMDILKDDIFISTVDGLVRFNKCRTPLHINPADSYYRVRGVNGRDDSIANNPDALFHIPMSMKAYTNNERFSIVGFPSLYLSTMLPLAWQECGYPKKYYYSEYQYEKQNGEKRILDNEMKLLSLHSPREIDIWGISVKYNDFDLWLEVIVRYLKQYPLILACSFVNHKGAVSYKQEYVIPQMLMQWVQRHPEFVQGISYFTCVDTKMDSSSWCAYNIAIPIMKPLDDKQYSEPLREAFCWEKPKYFEVPLINKYMTKIHREKLHQYIDKLIYVSRNYYVNWCHNLLSSIKSICVSLYQLMDKGDTADMKLIIHVIEMIDMFYANIRCIDIENMINQYRKKLPEYEKEVFEESIDPIMQVINEFIVDDKSSDSIYSIINMYKNTLWNDHHCKTRILVLYSDKDDINSVNKWLHENHLIHCAIKLDKKNLNVESLKKICKQYNLNIEDFWDESSENDEWILKNYETIKTPVFIRSNSRSIYDLEPKEMYDYCHFGFDIDILKRDLL